MIYETLDFIITQQPKLLNLFDFDETTKTDIIKSWENKSTDLLLRFDVLFDGENGPKLIECNADTPTLLLESMYLQQQWSYKKNK